MSYGQKVVHNLETGEITYVDLTAEEIAQRDAERQEAVLAEQNRPAPPPENAQLYARIKQLEDALVELYELLGGA